MTRISKLEERGLVKNVEIYWASILDGSVVGLEYWVNDMPDGQGHHSCGFSGSEVMHQLSVQARGVVTYTGHVHVLNEDIDRVELEILAEYRRRKTDPKLVGAIGGVFPVA